MAKRDSKSQATWTDVKARLADLDRAGLLGLVHELYASHEDNRTFLHARFGLGDILKSCKKIIDRWMWPDVLRGQDTSVSKAKQAISDYKKAVGDSAGLAEVMVFYCEQAAGFCDDVGYQDEAHFDAMVRMFEQAIKLAATLLPGVRDILLARLDRVRRLSHRFGYGVGDNMDSLFTKYGRREG